MDFVRLWNFPNDGPPPPLVIDEQSLIMTLEYTYIIYSQRRSLLHCGQPLLRCPIGDRCPSLGRRSHLCLQPGLSWIAERISFRIIRNWLGPTGLYSTLWTVDIRTLTTIEVNHTWVELLQRLSSTIAKPWTFWKLQKDCQKFTVLSIRAGVVAVG